MVSLLRATPYPYDKQECFDGLLLPTPTAPDVPAGHHADANCHSCAGAVAYRVVAGQRIINTQ